MTQLMPLLLTVSCFSKIQIGFTFLGLAHPHSPGLRAVKRLCVCAGGLQIRGKPGHKLTGFGCERQVSAQTSKNVKSDKSIR